MNKNDAAIKIAENEIASHHLCQEMELKPPVTKELILAVALKESVELIGKLEEKIISIKRYEGLREYPEHEVRHAIAVEMPFECDEALELIGKWKERK